MTGIQKAIAAAGSQQAVADFLGVSQQAVSEMERKGHAPLKHIVALESEYGIPRIELISPHLRDLLVRE